MLYFLYFQALTPIQNDTKEVKTSSLENAKPQDDDEEINKQTAADVQTFKEVNPLNSFFFSSGRFLVTITTKTTNANDAVITQSKLEI